MAYASGTAADYNDFIRSLIAFITGGTLGSGQLTNVATGVGVTDVQATGVLTLGSTPSNGDTVTIDTITYTFKTAITLAAYDVLIGGSAAAAATNLIDAITRAGTPGTNYSAATVLHPTVTAATGGSGVVDVTCVFGGTGGNTIVTTATGTISADWGAATLTGATGVAVRWRSLPTPSTETGIPGSGLASGCTAYVQGPGSNNADQIIVGLQTYSTSGAGIYGFQLKGFSAYNQQETYNTMPGRSTGVNVSLNNATFNCWFWCNGRRWMAAARIGSVDVFLYAGFILQFGTRSQYPYPLVVAGQMATQAYAYSENDYGNAGLPDPGPGNCYFRWVDGTWQVIQHYTSTTLGSATNTNDPSVWPVRDTSANDGAEVSNASDEDSFWYQYSAGTQQMSSTEIATYPILPCLLHGPTRLIGQFDGLYVNPGLSLNPGDTLTDPSANVYDVFHMGWRTQANNFFCVLRA
jgi:hypothetical protein